jgi:hypothetical protein
MSKSFLVILGLRWDLFTGDYALFIYQNRVRSYEFFYIGGSDKETDDLIRLVSSF